MGQAGSLTKNLDEPMRKPRVRKIFPVALSVAETAEAVGASVRGVREWIATGKLPAHLAKRGRKLIIVSDLVDFIRTNLPRA